MTSQEEGKKTLEDELVRLGFPGDRRGDARVRAELLASEVGSVKNWLTGRNKTPKFVWWILKLYSLLPAEKREEFRMWTRGQSD